MGRPTRRLETVVTYREILSAYETGDLDAMSALELSGCGTVIELYEGAADEEERLVRSEAISASLQLA